MWLWQRRLGQILLHTRVQNSRENLRRSPGSCTTQNWTKLRGWAKSGSQRGREGKWGNEVGVWWREKHVLSVQIHFLFCSCIVSKYRFVGFGSLVCCLVVNMEDECNLINDITCVKQKWMPVGIAILTEASNLLWEDSLENGQKMPTPHHCRMNQVDTDLAEIVRHYWENKGSARGLSGARATFLSNTTRIIGGLQS